jgi:alpha-mannosidase
MEEGKWEYGMQKWIDISDNDIGMAVLNTSKYGVSANKRGISITLIRSPQYPRDPYHTREIKIDPKNRPKFTDLGKHSISLRLIPHKRSWIDEEIPHKALAYNNPVVYVETNVVSPIVDEDKRNNLSMKDVTLNDLPGREILLPTITSDHSHVIISAFKPSEWISEDYGGNQAVNSYKFEDYTLPESPLEWNWDQKTLVIRAYECAGTKVSTSIRLHNIPEKYEIIAEEMDLLEYNIGKKLEIVHNMANKTIVIHTEFKPFEIKSIRLTIK